MCPLKPTAGHRLNRTPAALPEQTILCRCGPEPQVGDRLRRSSNARDDGASHRASHDGARLMPRRRGKHAPATLAELARNLPESHLLGFAESYKLLNFLQGSPRRLTYLKRAKDAFDGLTDLREGEPPDRMLWRKEVAVGLATCGDVREHLRAKFRLRGHDLCSTKTKRRSWSWL